jgi:hypothetical protein
MAQAIPCVVPCLVTVVCIIMVVVGLRFIANMTFFAPVPTGLDPTSAESAEFWDTGADRARMRQKLLIAVVIVFLVGQAAGYFGVEYYKISQQPTPPTVKEIVDATMTAIYAQTETINP